MSGNAAAAVLTRPAFRKIEWLNRDIAVERRPDGVIVLKSRIPLQAYEKHIPASLAKWANEAPDRIWLAQRTGADRHWRKVSYGEAKRMVDALTQALLNLGLDAGSPVAILSGNSIEHALMTQAAMQAHPMIREFERVQSVLRIAHQQEVAQRRLDMAEKQLHDAVLRVVRALT